MASIEDRARLLECLSESQKHQIVSSFLLETNPDEWQSMLEMAVWRSETLNITCVGGRVIEIPREPLMTVEALKRAVAQQLANSALSLKLLHGVRPLADDELVAALPVTLTAVIFKPLLFLNTSDSLSCELLNGGSSVRCVQRDGFTGQWEHVFGDMEASGDLEFAVRLDALNGRGGANNVCIGVAPSNFSRSTAGGGMNANAATVAFGIEMFPMSGHYKQCNSGVRWKEGDTVRVVYTAETGDVKFFWDAKLRATLIGMPLQHPVRPVVFMWYQGDQVSFVQP